MTQLLRMMAALVAVTIPVLPQEPWAPHNPYRWDHEIDHGTLKGHFIRAHCDENKNRTIVEVVDLVGARHPHYSQPITLSRCFDYKHWVDAQTEFFEHDDFDSIDTGRRSASRAAGVFNVFATAVGPTESVFALDRQTFGTVATVDVSPRLPRGLAMSPSGDRLYATLGLSTLTNPPSPAQILIVNTASNQALDRITLPADTFPSAPVVSLDGKLLYFADSAESISQQNSALVVVDLATRTVIERVPASAAGGAANRVYSVALSPDGGLICLTDTFGFAVLDTRTRTFVARTNVTLPNREIPAVFHPNGSKFYVVERRTVSGQLAVSLLAVDTSTLTEVSRVPLPATFDPRAVVMSPDGLAIATDGFLRPASGPARAVLIVIDTNTNAIVSTTEPTESTVGALSVIVN